MSFSNQETLTELGYKERMITGSMYAAMAQLMPAGDYSLNVVGKAVWELGRLLDLPLV
ncbi:hypothetical protein KA478_00200 [Patescibacteria group bacterium]|nr:hypothetical protein [Patescibacteria group bacterium]